MPVFFEVNDAFCFINSCGRQPCATSTVVGSFFRHCFIFELSVFFADLPKRRQGRGMSGLKIELEGFGACAASPGPGMLALSF